MNLVLTAGSAILGLLPFVVSPTKTFARGGVWKYVGAALIIVAAMSLFWSVRDMTGEGGEDGTPQVTDAEVQAMVKLLGG